MHFFLLYLKQRRRSLLIFLLFCAIFVCVFLLYHLPVGAVLYPAGLCALVGALLFFFDIRKTYQKHRTLLRLQKLSAAVMEDFPPCGTIDDADYQKIIGLLRDEQRETEHRMNGRYADMIDYYTIWAHQIKTPIASMRLNLQSEDTAFSRKISEDLFRIEQYVEMVLCYLRLDSGSTDYIIREYDLDSIIKQAVKKFAPQFIRRKIQLFYEPVHASVLTDEKWLLFVIEQVLSNALKYTESGSITITLETPLTLCVRDTGIGIAPEDLPRIFEKGYTGYNGRNDKKASGIGLYICRRICKNLGHTITATSSLDSGTEIRLELARENIKIE